MTADLIQRLRGPFPATTSTEVLWLLSEAIDALLSAESDLAKLREENARAGWRPIDEAHPNTRGLAAAIEWRPGLFRARFGVGHGDDSFTVFGIGDDGKVSLYTRLPYPAPPSPEET